MDNSCWPDWLTRENVRRFGPEMLQIPPYPVYSVYLPLLSPRNSNPSSQAVSPSHFASHSSVVAAANINTTIIEVIPQNVYDTLDIIAVDLGHTSAVPIFVSFDEPRGRIVTRTPISPEVNLITANPFAVTLATFDPASMPAVLSSGQASPNFYTCLHYNTPYCNTPFYVWFGDGLQTAPNPGAAFKIQWTTVGR